jgi:cell division septation protein DedD
MFQKSLTSYQIIAVFLLVISVVAVPAGANASVAARGDSYYISGIAQGNPSAGVAIWIFGYNYYQRQVASVDSGSFSFELRPATTSRMDAGRYYVVIQSPGANGAFEVVPATIAPGTTAVLYQGQQEFVVSGPGALQGSAAAEALKDVIDSQFIDDLEDSYSFYLENPYITISPSGTLAVGDTITISGTTNLATGNEMIIEISSSSFRPTSKFESSGFSGYSGTTVVEEGVNANTWSLDIDTAGYTPDEYTVTVESVTSGTSATSIFTLAEAGSVPPRTAATTTAATQAQTTQVPPTTVPTTEAPLTTGILLAGLLIACCLFSFRKRF